MHVDSTIAPCVNPHMTARTPPIAARAKALRLRLGLTQDQVAQRAAETDPEFRRDYVTKVESGANKGTSSRIRAGLARAFRLTTEDLSTYLDGTVSLDDLTARTGRVPARVDPPPPRDAPAEIVYDPDDVSPLETALTHALDASRHLARDAEAVRQTLRQVNMMTRDDADLTAAARQWLDAAAALRKVGMPITPATLLVRVTLGRVPDSVVAVERERTATAQAHDAARAQGVEPVPAKTPPRT